MRKFSLLSVLILAFSGAGCSDDDGSDCIDDDGDGYGVGADCEGPDCDDTDPAIWAEMSGYPDEDEDGVYSDVAVQLCTDGNLPSNYSETTGTDCDDGDAAVYEELTGYMDSDGDGVGAATAMEETLCTDGTLPAGYSDVGTDCDDSDASVFEAVTGYPDLDGDTVCADATMMACTAGDLPTGWCDTAGTDCDDYDPYVSDDASGLACELKGVCVDTEGATNPTLADLRGVGACQSIDCNGALPAAWDPTPTTSNRTCDDDTDCVATNDEYCFDLDADGTAHCQVPNHGCNYDYETGHTCSEIPGCLNQCAIDNPNDQAAYAQCLQFTCIEGATPKAQLLYMPAQECAAENGCFAVEDTEGCVSANCSDVFLPCIADVP